MGRKAVGFCVVVCLMLVGCGSQDAGGVKVAEGKQSVEPVKVAEKAPNQEKAIEIPREKFTNSIGMEFRKSWSDSLDFGSPPLVRAAGL